MGERAYKGLKRKTDSNFPVNYVGTVTVAALNRRWSKR